MKTVFAITAALICGSLSGCGVGGGTLLTLYMTLAAETEQHTAQLTNLLYFIPASSLALISHIKNRLVDKTAAIYAAIPGVTVSAVTSFAAGEISSPALRTMFGVFLIVTGAAVLLKKSRKNS